MLETFLVLLAGGIMLAVAISNPHDVTLNWLRLGGILSLVFAGLSAFWYFTHGADRSDAATVLIVATIVTTLAQLAFAQTNRRLAQRSASFLAAGLASASASFMIHRTWIAMIGIAAMCGIVLMDMLIGHAYLTASKMTMTPFRRLNAALAVTLLLRVMCNVLAGVR